MGVTNYELRKTKAQYFTGPFSEFDIGFKTTPELLRAVADYIDEHDIQDPELYDIVLNTEFTGRTNDYFGDDPYRQSVTLYYLDNPQRPSPEEEHAHYIAMEQKLRDEGKLD